MGLRRNSDPIFRQFFEKAVGVSQFFPRFFLPTGKKKLFYGCSGTTWIPVATTA